MDQNFINNTLSLFRAPAALSIRKGAVMEFINRVIISIKSSENVEPKGYQELTVPKIKSLSDGNINLTAEYSSNNTPDSIAVHFIQDVIYYESGWYCSTKCLVEDLLRAEANDSIIAHLLYINSPGGSTYYLDEAWKTIRSLKKPVIAFGECDICSAALWIASAADKIYVQNQFDTIGSIGVMMSFWDMRKYLQEMGLQLIEEYATESTHKNKNYLDLLEGKSEDYIKNMLDPFAELFISSVKTSRPLTAKAPEESHLFNGEVFFAPQATSLGLIDGIKPFAEVVDELYQLGKSAKENLTIQNNAINQL